MTNALYGATLLLAAALASYAAGSRAAARTGGAVPKLPTVLAALAVVTLVAILARAAAAHP